LSNHRSIVQFSSQLKVASGLSGRAENMNCENLGMLKTNLIPGVSFTNILRKANTHVDPENDKKTNGLTVFLALLESAHVKSARKTFMKRDNKIGYSINTINNKFLHQTT